MAPVTVELYTEDPCPGPECDRCRELTNLSSQIAFSGARRALNKVLGPFGKAPPVQVRHLACHEAEDPEMCREALPQLRVNSKAVLVGGHWTEAEVKQAIEAALTGDQEDGSPSEAAA